VLGRGGALHAKRVNSDEPLEVLPRPLWRGQLLGEVLALLPLRDGFALVATGGPCLSEGHYVAGYNFAACTVKCFKLCGMMPSGEFLSFPDTNCIAVRCSQFVPVTRWVIVADFTSCESVHHDHGNPSTSLDPRASEAACRAIERARTEYPVPAAVNTASLDPSPSLHREQAALWLSLPGGRQVWLTPTAEGKPVFENATVVKGVLAADALAVVATEGNLSSLWVLRVSDSAVLHQQGDVSPKLALTLSPDGRWLARQTAAGRGVEVRSLGGAAVERLANGGYHNAFAMHVSAECLQVVVGRYRHRFALDQIPFAYEATASDRANGWHLHVIDPNKVLTAYDGKRFGTPAAAGPWVAVHDHWGQVVLMNAVGDLVMHVCVCREMWAVVLPDGTRCWSAALLGGAPTPDAERLVGEWLRKHGR